MRKQIIVDVGAGSSPDQRATDAIDVMSKEDVAYVRRRLPKRERGKDLRELDYHYGRDMAKRGTVPSELKGKADLIISNNALGVQPQMAYKVKIISANLDSLAKPDGKIDIKVGYVRDVDKRETLKATKSIIQGAHFSNPTIKDNKRTREMRIKAGRVIDLRGKVHKQRRGSVI